MQAEVQFTPYLVSFYPDIKLDYLKQDENQNWYVEQVKVDTSEWYNREKANRGIKTSQTSASLIFYDENQNDLFSKLLCENNYPYGFIWNIDNNTDDECIFCQTDGHIVDGDFTNQTCFKPVSINGISQKNKRGDPVLFVARKVK